MTPKRMSDLLMKKMITDRIGRPEVLLPIIKNITLSEDLRKDKKMVKILQNQSHMRKV